jgi:SAM-dependent methyltransferase
VDAEGALTFRVSASAYGRHVGRYGRELAERLCAVAAIGPGQAVLDVGCGPGALTAVLAGLVGPNRVTAVDPSEPFVLACRDVVPGADVQVARAEELPFSDGSFDAVLSQLVVNFMSEPELGVREMRRVAGLGGTVASAVWDYAGEMTILRRFWDAAVALDPGAVELDEGRSMPYCTPGELEALWSGAGLADVAVAPVTVSAGYEGFDDLWEPLEHGVAPSGAYAAALPDDRSAALKEELRRRLGVGAAPFRLTARAWVATGRRR